MPDLLMIVPTRNRPQNAMDLYRSWVDTTSAESTLLFVVDNDDPQLGSYKNQLRWMQGVQLLTVPPRLRMVGALNYVAIMFAVDYKYLGFMGDDHRPRTRNWDNRIRAAIKHPVGIAYGNDLLQGEKMPTAVVMTANIVDKLGYMVPLSLQHLCADLVWKDWGESLGCLTYLDDVYIEHMHPANGKAEMDAGYKLVNSPEQNKHDADAYYAYKDDAFHSDVAKLKELL